MRSGEKYTRSILRIRSDGLCERCGRHGTTVHHRKNRSQGGRWTPANCVALCGDGTRGCHGWVTEHPEKAHEQGWTVWSFEDEYNEGVELWQAGGQSVLLNIDGSWELEDLEAS